jgi:fructoselysine-6-P-deglycase FrlB-like protein
MKPDKVEAALRTLAWKDAMALPRAIRSTLEQATGFSAVTEFLGQPHVRRIVAAGNGASYYVALSLALAANASGAGPQVVAVPAGLLVPGRFHWRDGDVLLALSSSGELTDLITGPPLIGAGAFAAITSTVGSTLHRGAAAAAVVRSFDQRSLTHTQTYCGAVVAALAIWTHLIGDGALREQVALAPDIVEKALGDAWPFVSSLDLRTTPSSAVAMGSGVAWAAALETALLLKEVSGVPGEGVETREGATSAMFALTSNSLVISIDTPGDAQLMEAETSCASMGAKLVRIPAPIALSQCLAPIWSFPYSLALALYFAEIADRDPDDPPWARAYLATVRPPSGEGRTIETEVQSTGQRAKGADRGA